MTKGFPAAAHETLANAQLRRNLGKATTTIRAKRLRAVGELPDWEALRDAGAAIKARAMATLPEQLERLEASVTRAGGVVHWARDGAEANAIVASVARAHQAREVIKVKSIATDEIGLNEALAAQGISAIETDLAELILQLSNDKTSHILVPAIHRNRMEIKALFERTITDEELGYEASAIAEAARKHLRAKFLSVPVAVSGANFGVAETGTVVVVELDDQLGEVGLDGQDAGGGERLVQPDLVRGDRLHLHDLVHAVTTSDRRHDRARFTAVLRPMHLSAGR